MEMLKKRLTNPYFYIAFIGLFLTATGIVPEDLTSWAILWEKIVSVFANPYLLGTFVVAAIGQYVNLATSGLKD